MSISEFSRYALGICAAAAMLAGCGGSQPPIGAAGATPSSRANILIDSASNTLARQQTFHYTGSAQTFQVPTGVTRLTVVARGAEGGGASGSNSYQPFFEGGIGGRLHAQISVKPGETLYIYVGGAGVGSGGFNGGAPGGSYGSQIYAYGGGGASDVRQGGDKLKNRILVAAGGWTRGRLEFVFRRLGGKGRRSSRRRRQLYV
jgi:hypothetical protein